MSISLRWKQFTCKHIMVETYPFSVCTHHYNSLGKLNAITTKEYIVTECKVCGAVRKSRI